MKNKNPENKEKGNTRSIEKTVYRFFGVPFFSVSHFVHADEFYSEMSSRFGREMTERVLKVQAGR